MNKKKNLAPLRSAARCLGSAPPRLNRINFYANSGTYTFDGVTYNLPRNEITPGCVSSTTRT